MALDPETALVTLTHDPKLDLPAVVAGLNAGCFYVGALGSRRTHQKRVESLKALDVSVQQIDRIQAPIGLPIGGRSPAEVAVAIIAQIVAAKTEAAAAGSSEGFIA
jgi:xanthine dehydrogenase accessory factor